MTGKQIEVKRMRLSDCDGTACGRREEEREEREGEREGERRERGRERRER
jgi:hypothetical protein